MRTSCAPEKIILFGSYAWGNPSVDSNVDLFVIVDASDEPGSRRARSVYAALRGVVVPIDLIVKTQEEVQQSANVVTSLTKKVLEEGQVLYG
ncbi:nucleotidyltransferase domain-containing protein [bacterium AH-315-G11]|nr:nucleotidyltransferase domain-containing protein [bacterium AH-315-G11]